MTRHIHSFFYLTKSFSNCEKKKKEEAEAVYNIDQADIYRINQML